MKNILIISLCALAALLLFSGCGRSKKAAEAAKAQAKADSIEMARLDSIKAADDAAKEAKAMALLATMGEEPVFNIVTTMGTIKVKLYKKTPLHRQNFAKLALTGYYDSLLFHRVIYSFMIQGGDPLSKDPAQAPRSGTGGPGYTVPAEFVPEYKHKKGALAAARRGDAANPMKESSGSQFYIVQNEQTCAQLDGAYTVFGETIEGLDVIDKIAAVETDRRDRPVAQVKIVKIKAE
jgi:peptidyl-prolyl cis-trans isomerase B (cyclophilin B)